MSSTEKIDYSYCERRVKLHELENLCAENRREIEAKMLDIYHSLWYDYLTELRYNHNHDSKGRFCSGGGNNSGVNISNVYTGHRNEIPLTKHQKEEAIQYLEKLGMDMDLVLFSDNQRTVYQEKYNSLIVGTDILPMENPKVGTKNANQRISMKGALAHEIIGHREAHINGFTQRNDTYEEVQASIRAAKFAPDLSNTERITLLRDARARLGNSERLKDIKDKLHIGER